MIFHTFTADETEDIGRKLAQHLKPNSIIALNGVLGAGKTVLTRGIARGLGIDGIIKSPTFTIICEYEGRLPLYHMDMYRISSDDEFELTGGKELLTAGGVCVIEWSENIKESLPKDIISISIKVITPEEREIEIEGIEL
ncbi:MAG: tRNA (adenosine(37)-N6)-threonylcarbamoyltransferase complex ATPase subunit type 1 TsaE [Spirochaetia bacterium]|nr:tRNA (adenosine(37)-N6)-threonylcarbamoyltransferase complex ATPase subunit type 1 TsaE [Spirochaetia bacterium]